MFQIEPILYLQSFISDSLTSFMRGITVMGYDPFFIGITMFIMLGISFRRGFILLQLVLWGVIVNNFLKQLFALPRPIYANNQVQNLGSSKLNTSEFTSMGAKGFFAPLEQQVVNAFRLQADPSYGFPSGHVQGTTVLWGGISLLFKTKIFRWLTPVVILLMALSRMYLGRHFLADVIGGAALGGILLYLAYQLNIRYALQERFFERANFILSARLPTIIFLSFMFVIPLFLALNSLVDGDIVGYLVGINAGFLMVMSKGLPDDSGTILVRIARVLLAILFFFAISFIVKFVIGLSSLDGDLIWIKILETAIPNFIALWIGVNLCVKLGLYKREKI
ncbi:MAG: phosphatase PAP2 family protein [Chloroflexi bacterium]|nr:phosphatase PAP2 family protein [Chloroflexota bacterium]